MPLTCLFLSFYYVFQMFLIRCDSALLGLTFFCFDPVFPQKKSRQGRLANAKNPKFFESPLSGDSFAGPGSGLIGSIEDSGNFHHHFVPAKLYTYRTQMSIVLIGKKALFFWGGQIFQNMGSIWVPGIYKPYIPLTAHRPLRNLEEGNDSRRVLDSRYPINRNLIRKHVIYPNLSKTSSDMKPHIL